MMRTLFLLLAAVALAALILIEGLGLDPLACLRAREAPTDSNLFACYGDVEGAHW